MTFDPAQRLQEFHDAINALDFATIQNCFADDAVYLSVGTGDISGREAIMAAFRRYFAAYGDQVASNERIETLGPFQARSFWQLKASHAETRALLIRKGIETITFNEDGLITEVLVEDR